MKHFVGYHNEVGQGYPAHGSDPLSIYSNKPLDHLIGDALWLVEGVGETPKQFRLAVAFVVNEVGPSENESFQFGAWGEGRVFNEAPLLNSLEWFPDFFQKLGHFAFGVVELTDDRFIDGLVRLAITNR